MKKPKILLITPPLTQINTPYPATAYIKGFLGQKGFEVVQADLGIELILRLFSRKGLQEVFTIARQSPAAALPPFSRLLHLEKNYLQTIDSVIRFLQGKDATLATRISYGGFLPEGGRFETLEDLEWAFGSMGIADRAKFLCTLYLEDLGDLITACVSPYFGFSRYAEKLALSVTSFNPLENALNELPTLTDRLLEEILQEYLNLVQPDLVGFSVPFPGNVYAALRCARMIKQTQPHIQTLMGGGYVNTELRSLKESRIFKYIDYITLDDGESPLLRIIEHWQGLRSQENLHRTFILHQGEVAFFNGCQQRDIAHTEVGTPDYSDLPLDKYLQVIEIANPMHRLWNDGRWNKLTVAHGCYWKKCSFCDITLDYISRYETAPAALLVDRIETIIAQTGETGFHFVDEAAPPLALRDLAIEILKRGISISWWTNIRFEKTFSPDLCRLLAASGCIAVSGGLEVASDRLLALMEKGVTVEQVAKVAHAFTQAGIMVHAYLMYGFPTQTTQETIDSLEVVRQLMENGVIQSGFWHRFSMTAHSPVGKNPAKYQVHAIGPEAGLFANNDLIHEDPTGGNHEQFAEGLSKAMFNYMHGVFFEEPVNYWFSFRTPRTTIPSQLINRALSLPAKSDLLRLNSRVLWLGSLPQVQYYIENKKGKARTIALITFYNQTEDIEIKLPEEQARWLLTLFPQLMPESEKPVLLKDLVHSFPVSAIHTFESFIGQTAWKTLRSTGLVLV
ncbi:radical SAM protein [Rhodocytophaga rosea]|uniref:Radical SAM protein n=1 Tax=Rhodocytophaga rosea TaxID=2704465 RepID=A0A6C0GC84_9BACT|nr:B12-binding domain-containing radical SAM protein [Rhodocytophaga rosea]QHT65565.1 radical SAM protein [Rhodocytophaga rosea]